MRLFRFSQLSKAKRILALFFAVNILVEVISPTLMLALTSGPGQQEFASFEPATTTDLVDLSSGDFNYNIPLLSIPGPNGGYPINLAYHSGIGMEEEASWVGLGWNVNVGAITRQLRGLPDDYNGESIKHTYSLKPNHTFGLTVPRANDREYREFFGFPETVTNNQNVNNWTWQLYYNNYKGLGYRAMTAFPRPEYLSSQTEDYTEGLGLSFDSQQGIGAEINLSLKHQFKKFKGGLGLDLQVNSRQGITNFNFSSDLSVQSSGSKKGPFNWKSGKNDKLEASGGGFGSSSALSFSSGFGVPHVSLPTKTTSFNLALKFGTASNLPVAGNLLPVFGYFSSKYPKKWDAYSSSTYLANKGVVVNPTQGYIYTDASPLTNAIKDFQRKDIPYSKKVPNLATSAFTHDVYVQTGQGTSSMFRPYFNKVALLNDASMSNKENGYVANVEVGKSANTLAQLGVHVGLGFTHASGENYSGAWQDIGNNPDIHDNLKPALSNTSIDYEPAYFQVYGENAGTLLNDDQLTMLGGDEALRVKLIKDDDLNWLNRQFKAENVLIPTTGSSGIQITQANKIRQKRQKRATSVEGLNNAEASLYGISRSVKYYDITTGTDVAKTFNLGQSGLMSEYKIKHADGMKYVYGLPALNKKHIENTFALKEDPLVVKGFNDITIDNIPQINDKVDLSNTYDEFQSKTENLNSYAHSWMLTTVCSNDYIDLTNNGPSDDDYGYWVNFGYQKTSNDYKWRMPYKGANLFLGLNNMPTNTNTGLNDAFDDKGSYSYGTKELFYLKKIETKTHIAIFQISAREDAIGAKDELNGGMPSSPGIGDKMYKLDRISLYSKSTYVDGAVNVPIKEVNFEYTYELCQGVLNNIHASDQGNTLNKGKLTLKKVYFTYQTSSRGSFSPYEFDYGDLSSPHDNPTYEILAMDRWGNYKDINSYVFHNDMNSTQSNLQYPIALFPYTEQDDDYNHDGTINQTDIDLRNKHAGAWCLKKIKLPTGGEMKIEYEQDDYAYVEGQRATRMLDIVGIGDECPLLNQVACTTPNNFAGAGRTPYTNTTATAVNAYTEARVPGDLAANDCKIYFKLEKPIPIGTPNANLEIQKYTAGLKDNMLYFKTYAKLRDDLYDYVEGYAKLSPNPDYYGVYSTGHIAGMYDLGYITLEQVPLNKLNVTGVKVSPFTKAAIEHLRMNRPEFVYDSAPNSNNFTAQIQNLIGSVISAPQELFSAMFLFNTYAFGAGWGNQIRLNGYSVIKLCDPDNSKKGGGHRVKRITIDDRWSGSNSGTPLSNSTYGLEYDYTTKDAYGQTMSSGVAYEPSVGSNESALKSPVNYTNSTLLASQSHLFVEQPVMEDFYPGASVTYSKVTVKSIAASNAKADNSSNNLIHTSAPSTVYEFYTGKDFPVIVDETDLSTDPAITRPIMIPGIYSSFKKRKARSQGYSVVLNDMTGKMKSVSQVVAATGAEISKTTYVYSTEAPYNPNSSNKLLNKVQVLNNNGTYQTAIIGQSHDMYIDNNENSQKSKTRGLDANLDFYAAPIPAVFFITPFPTLSDVQTSMRTIVTTKVISRSGILKKVITKNDESVIETESIAYDIETGSAILSKVTNEFGDPVYSFNYPGHWYYPALRGDYINQKIALNGSFTAGSCGQVDVSSALTNVATSPLIVKGDQVYANCVPANLSKVYTVFDKGNNFIKLMDDDGSYIPSSTQITSIKVVNSGYDNQQSVSVGSVEAMTTNVKAFNKNDGTTNLENPQAVTYDKVLNASAIEMSENWQTFSGSYEAASACGFSNQGVALIHLINDISYSFNANTIPSQVLLYDANTSTSYHGYDPVLSIGNNTSTFSVYLSVNSSTNPLVWSLQYYNSQANTYTTFCQYTTNEWPEQLNIPDYISDNNLCVCMSQTPNTLSFETNSCGGYYGWSSCDGSLGETDRQIPDTSGQNLTSICTPYTMNLTSCYNLFTSGTNSNTCGVLQNSVVNPYKKAIKGIWRPKSSYTFNTGRTQNDNIKNDGVYTDFVQFPWLAPATKSQKWINSNTITKYSPYGFELENKNAIGIFSAALYGYKNSLSTAVGSNAKYNELAFDGFEDYPADCEDDHFRYSDFTQKISNNFAHTGSKSMKIVSADAENVFVQRNVTTGACTNYVLNPSCANLVGPFKLQACDFLGVFGPIPGKQYVLSAWTKVDYGTQNTISVTNYPSSTIKVEFLDASSTVISSATINTQGDIIEGWQRLYGTFKVPANTASVKVILKGSSPTQDTYFDDIRIHPFDGNMVSYVYDPLTYKLVAELDDNNYATFYIYDDEGQLVKVKKETIEGIKTIKEGRTNTKKIQ
jgi:hypothetical protein